MTWRLRPASRPSLRRCRLASRRVDPWGRHPVASGGLRGSRAPSASARAAGLLPRSPALRLLPTGRSLGCLGAFAAPSASAPTASRLSLADGVLTGLPGAGRRLGRGFLRLLGRLAAGSLPAARRRRGGVLAAGTAPRPHPAGVGLLEEQGCHVDRRDLGVRRLLRGGESEAGALLRSVAGLSLPGFLLRLGGLCGSGGLLRRAPVRLRGGLALHARRPDPLDDGVERARHVFHGGRRAFLGRGSSWARDSATAAAAFSPAFLASSRTVDSSDSFVRAVAAPPDIVAFSAMRRCTFQPAVGVSASRHPGLCRRGSTAEV